MIRNRTRSPICCPYKLDLRLMINIIQRWFVRSLTRKIKINYVFFMFEINDFSFAIFFNFFKFTFKIPIYNIFYVFIILWLFCKSISPLKWNCKFFYYLLVFHHCVVSYVFEIVYYLLFCHFFNFFLFLFSSLSKLQKIIRSCVRKFISNAYD